MTDKPSLAVTADTIRDAYPYISARVSRTPIFKSGSIAARISPDLSMDNLLLKMENLQRTGAFKLRGATWKIATLTDDERSRGVIGASAGNHAQGLALAAREAGVAATIFMSKLASVAKIQATESYGARVVLVGENFDEAVAAAQEEAKTTGAVWVSAYDDDAIITGQGSLGIEMLEDIPDLGTVIIPIGGGGLFSGVATAIKAARPACRVIGVQAAGSDTAARSFQAGHLVKREKPVETIADGIAVKSPSPRTWGYIAKYADDVVTVTDERIAEAVLLLVTRAKAVVEPSGAASLAALMEYPHLAQGKTAALLCGGNIDVGLLADIIERSMIRSSRYFHFFSACPDKPGSLARLLDVVAQAGGNVIQVTHDRLSPDIPFGRTGVELLVEMRDEAHITALEKAVLTAGYPVRRMD